MLKQNNIVDNEIKNPIRLTSLTIDDILLRNEQLMKRLGKFDNDHNEMENQLRNHLIRNIIKNTIIDRKNFYSST